MIFAEFAEVAKSLEEYGGLPTIKQASDIWDDIWYVEAHNSTAIEGNTLVLREVKALLQQQRTVGGKKLKEYLEVEGYGKASKWVYGQARAPKSFAPTEELVTLFELRMIHEELMGPVWSIFPHKDAMPSENPGSFRQHDIHPFDGGMIPPPFTDIAPRIRWWIDDVNAFGAKVAEGIVKAEDIPLQLAQIHCGFEKIHPFLDGNGRTGRLLLNLILVRLGFPPAIILKSRRTQYIKTLDKADNNFFKPLAEIICKAVLDNVHRFIMPKYAENSDLVRIDSLVTKEFSYVALRQAALRGKLQAQVRDDGKWYSTREAVWEYKKSKFRHQ
jgi:fido (protein-threonine AMPylation protein)